MKKKSEHLRENSPETINLISTHIRTTEVPEELTGSKLLLLDLVIVCSATVTPANTSRQPTSDLDRENEKSDDASKVNIKQ